MDAKDINKFDEATTFLNKALPASWRQLFNNCIEEGFTETQALDLVKTYIIAQGCGDKKPPNT